MVSWAFEIANCPSHGASYFCFLRHFNIETVAGKNDNTAPFLGNAIFSELQRLPSNTIAQLPQCCCELSEPNVVLDSRNVLHEYRCWENLSYQSGEIVNKPIAVIGYHATPIPAAHSRESLARRTTSYQMNFPAVRSTQIGTPDLAYILLEKFHFRMIRAIRLGRQRIAFDSRNNFKSCLLEAGCKSAATREQIHRAPDHCENVPPTAR